jgi:heme exporter protein D
MGNAKSRNTMQSTMNVSAKATNKAINDVIASGRSFQGINVSGVEGDVNISGVDMDASVQMTAKGYLEAAQSNEASQSVSQELEQMAKASVSGINLGNNSDSSNSVSVAINAASEILNVTAQTCDLGASATQLINVTDVGGNVNISDVKMKTAISVIVDCQAKAVANNSSIQDMQNKVSQTAIAETVGFDPFAIFIALAVLIAVVGAVVLMMGKAVKDSSSIVITAAAKWLIPTLCIAGMVLLIWYISQNSLSQVVPPEGEDIETFVIQYLFMDQARVKEDCGPVVFEDVPYATLLPDLPTATPPTLRETTAALNAWVFAYNDKVQAHREKIGKDYAALPMVEPAQRSSPPAADAPTSAYWPYIKVANIDQKRRVITAYGGEPHNGLRAWNQWAPSPDPVHPSLAEHGTNVYTPNDRFVNTTRANVLSLLADAVRLMDKLRCVAAGIAPTMYNVESACALKIKNSSSELFRMMFGTGTESHARVAQQIYMLLDPTLSTSTIWHALTGKPPASTDGATIDLTADETISLETMPATVQIPQFYPGETTPRTVFPVVAALHTTARWFVLYNSFTSATKEEDRVKTDALNRWRGEFNTWKAKLDKGFAHYDTGDVGNLDSIRDVTLVYAKRLNPVTKISPNANSPEPIFVSVYVWAGVGILVAAMAALFMHAHSAKQAEKGKNEREKEKAEIAAKSQQGAGGGLLSRFMPPWGMPPMGSPPQQSPPTAI